MPLYKVSLDNVEAANATQAEKVKESLLTILNTMSPQEGIDFAALLKEKPGIVQKANPFRNIC